MSHESWIDIRELIYPAHLTDTVKVFIKEAIAFLMKSNVEIRFHRDDLKEWILHSLRKFDWLIASLSLKSELSNSIEVIIFTQANLDGTV